MIAPALAILRFRARARLRSALSRSRRRSARAAVWCGIMSFAAATLALAAAMETVKPEWRDPEYGHRLRQLRNWKAQAPNRPLVVAFGSSRTQMGLCPAAMEFPDELQSPVVYNFGYRAANPFRSWVQLMRLLDDGVKPDFVLFQIAPIDLLVANDGRQLASSAGRLAAGDFRRLGPYTADTTVLIKPWAAARLLGWSHNREPVLSDLLPDWQPIQRRVDLYWERLDQYGFTPHHVEALTAGQYQESYERARCSLAPTFPLLPTVKIQDRAIRDLVARCRSETIPVALFWAPESPTYRSWYSPAGRARFEAYHRQIAEELGTPVFSAPDHLTDADFADGFHLLRPGAEKYSRWLADTHLKPWLARYRK
jgi:hypothetical protein